MSILYKGRGTENEGEIWYVNHKANHAIQLFTEAPDEEEIDREV